MDEMSMNGGGSQLALPAEEKPPIPELGKLGGEAIEKYTEAAAVHVEQVGDDLLKIAREQCDGLMKLAEHHHGECHRMAGEMREAAKIMAAQTVEFTAKVMSATTEVTALMDKAMGEVAAIRSRFAPVSKQA